jgi:hypothetical protein
VGKKEPSYTAGGNVKPIILKLFQEIEKGRNTTKLIL